VSPTCVTWSAAPGRGHASCTWVVVPASSDRWALGHDMHRCQGFYPGPSCRIHCLGQGVCVLRLPHGQRSHRQGRHCSAAAHVGSTRLPAAHDLNAHCAWPLPSGRVQQCCVNPSKQPTLLVQLTGRAGSSGSCTDGRAHTHLSPHAHLRPPRQVYPQLDLRSPTAKRCCPTAKRCCRWKGCSCRELIQLLA
jgi:hypothetical protein